MKKLILALALVVSTSAYGSAAVIDLSDPSVTSGTINGAEFVFSKQQPTGSGVFESFLRIQARGDEQGYNTDAGNKPFDELGGNFTHSLAFSSLVATEGYYNFLLDIDEANNPPNSLLSLDGLKFFSTSLPAQNSDSVDAAGNASGIIGTLLWDMDAGENNAVLLDASRGGNPGSGVSDMLLRIPVEYLTPTPGEDFLILWSRFGLLNVEGATSTGGFEEWTHVGEGGTEPVPEPGTMLLLGAGLASLALYSRRQSNR
jgi:hypothetical protein